MALCLMEEEEYMLWGASIIRTKRSKSLMRSGGQMKSLGLEKKMMR
jgi:hypothetical protein